MKFGEAVDSPKHEVKGAIKQAEGAVQERYGKAREVVRKHVDNRNKAQVGARHGRVFSIIVRGVMRRRGSPQFCIPIDAPTYITVDNTK